MLPFNLPNSEDNKEEFNRRLFKSFFPSFAIICQLQRLNSRSATPAAAAHLGPSRFPVPPFHVPPILLLWQSSQKGKGLLTEFSEVQPANQVDPMLGSPGQQNPNQPRVPNFVDPYQPYLGLHQMHIPGVPQNVSGRISVGLRWWNEINDLGESMWKFQSLTKSVTVVESGFGKSLRRMNKKDSWLFWWTLYITAVPGLCLDFLSHKVASRLLLIIGVCLTLSTATLLSSPNVARFGVILKLNFNGRCDHEQMKNANGCIVEIIGEKNLDHFFVGTRDTDMRKSFRRKQLKMAVFTNEEVKNTAQNVISCLLPTISQPAFSSKPHPSPANAHNNAKTA
uniref:Golgi apparatus membrane protein TVP23 n=1 Tax=Salix viminalis TaxID=40686 RepID=A0A6N2JZ84_SALVM